MPVPAYASQVKNETAIILAAMHHYGGGAALEQYDALEEGKSYSWEMVADDLKSIQRDLYQFNAQVTMAIQEANLPEINE